MTDNDRKARYNAAVSEIDEFCRIFGLKWKIVRHDMYCHDAYELVIYRERKFYSDKKCMNETVFDMLPERTRDKNFWTPIWKTAEKMLTVLKNGPLMVWIDKKVVPAENGQITTTIMREYRVPKFKSVSELKLILTANGSEFSSKI